MGAAADLLDRTDAAIKFNRADLIELVRATYAGDEQTMDKFRHKARSLAPNCSRTRTAPPSCSPEVRLRERSDQNDLGDQGW